MCPRLFFYRSLDEGRGAGPKMLGKAFRWKEKLRGHGKGTEFGQVEWQAVDSKLNDSAGQRISIGYS